MGLFSSGGGKAARAQMAQIRIGQEKAREQLAPVGELGLSGYREQAALLGLSGDREAALGRFRETPGIRFQQEEAQRATMRGASAMGGLVGGGTLAALQERSMGLAGQQFGSYLSQLGQFAQPGLQARSRLAGMEVQTAGQLGEAAAFRETSKASDRMKNIQMMASIAAGGMTGGLGGGFMALGGAGAGGGTGSLAGMGGGLMSAFGQGGLSRVASSGGGLGGATGGFMGSDQYGFSAYQDPFG